MRNNCLMGMGFLVGMLKIFWNLIEVVVAQHFDIPNATGLFTL